jgi:hypothetical protein
MPDLSGLLDLWALNQGKALLDELPALGSGESISRIYLHWSVESQGCVDGAYNIVVPLQGGRFRAVIATSPRLNATNPVQDGYAAHTYERNSNAVGIAVNGMDGAGVDGSNFGSDPVQLHAVEVMCAAAAAVALTYGIDASEQLSNGEFVIETHATVAVYDNYADERWDLGRLHPSPKPLTNAERTASAALLRARAHQYKLALMGTTA